MIDNFVTNRELLEQYAKKGVLHKKAAKKALKPVLDGYTSIATRFALLCMCFMSPEKILILTGGNVNSREMTAEQQREWLDLMHDAEEKAETHTPEGAILGPIARKNDNIRHYSRQWMLDYRKAICEIEWKRMFQKPDIDTHEFKFAREISEELERQGAEVKPWEFLTVYPAIAKMLPMRPGLSQGDIVRTVEQYLSNHGDDTDDE